VDSDVLIDGLIVELPSHIPAASGGGAFYRRVESEVVTSAWRAPSLLVVGSHTGPTGAAFLCGSLAKILHSISGIQRSAR